MVLNFCTSSDDALYLYQVSNKYLTAFQRYFGDAICILKFAKEHNSVKNVGRIMVLVVPTLPYHTLYLYQVLSKYLIRFQSYGPER